MHQSLWLFLAPENVPQATTNPPPAVARPAKPLINRRAEIRFAAAVLGNALGFGIIFAGCWFSIQLMQLLVAA